MDALTPQVTRRLREDRAVEELLTAVVDVSAVERLAATHRAALDHYLQALHGALEREDASSSIGTAKELVEAAAKSLIAATGQQPRARTTLVQLYRQALLSTGRDRSSEPGFDLVRGMTGVLDRLADLRNAHGTGHGRSAVPDVSMRDARLAARLAVAAIDYLFASDAADA